MPRVYWSAEAVRMLSTLPQPVQDDIISKTGLLAEFPRTYPVRRRGCYRGRRFITSFEWVVYYLDRSSNIVITTIGHTRRRSAQSSHQRPTAFGVEGRICHGDRRAPR